MASVSVSEVGRVLGRYVLYDAIASGGMATIHLGRLVGQVGFARVVAIKRLHPHLAKDPDFVAMFLDEARVAAGISHPNVVSTIDVVALQGELFLVMEYVEGDSLSHLIRDTRRAGKFVDPTIASAVMAGALYGLHAAHTTMDARGQPLHIVHRDVSPQNVLIGVDGVARMVDFGVAKAARRIQVTEAGRLKGKFSYMAPEMVRHSSVDHRADVFSAGICLWEALTGKFLFHADEPGRVIGMILEMAIPPPTSVVPSIPPALDAITARALERNPDKRYQSAREMAIALEDAVAPAISRKVGAWVETYVGPTLQKRNARLAELARDATTTGPINVEQLRSELAASTPAQARGAAEPAAVFPGQSGALTPEPVPVAQAPAVAPRAATPEPAAVSPAMAPPPVVAAPVVAAPVIAAPVVAAPVVAAPPAGPAAALDVATEEPTRQSSSQPGFAPGQGKYVDDGPTRVRVGTGGEPVAAAADLAAAAPPAGASEALPAGAREALPAGASEALPAGASEALPVVAPEPVASAPIVNADPERFGASPVPAPSAEVGDAQTAVEPSSPFAAASPPEALPGPPFANAPFDVGLSALPPTEPSIDEPAPVSAPGSGQWEPTSSPGGGFDVVRSDLHTPISQISVGSYAGPPRRSAFPLPSKTGVMLAVVAGLLVGIIGLIVLLSVKSEPAAEAPSGAVESVQAATQPPPPIATPAPSEQAPSAPSSSAPPPKASAKPTASAAPKPTVAPRPPPAEPTAAATSGKVGVSPPVWKPPATKRFDCNPPYTVDENGIKKFKKHCL